MSSKHGCATVGVLRSKHIWLLRLSSCPCLSCLVQQLDQFRQRPKSPYSKNFSQQSAWIHDTITTGSTWNSSSWSMPFPIGSMYAIYGNMDPINIPPMLAYMTQHHGSYGFAIYGIFSFFLRKKAMQILKCCNSVSWAGKTTSLESWSGESGWWFQTFFIFHNIWDVILPIDELIFFRGVGIPPTSDLLWQLFLDSNLQASGAREQKTIESDFFDTWRSYVKDRDRWEHAQFEKWLWVKTLVPGWYTNIAGKWMVIPP